eukprot:scaffold1973_cov399-Prasinococcus_capsulatus_cf.AAC.18
MGLAPGRQTNHDEHVQLPNNPSVHMARRGNCLWRRVLLVVWTLLIHVVDAVNRASVPEHRRGGVR